MSHEVLERQTTDRNLNRFPLINRIGHMWLQGLATDNPQHCKVMTMMSMVDAMASRQDFSTESMNTVGNVFCDNCRHIHHDVSTLCVKKGNASDDVLKGCWLMGLAS